MKKFIYLILAMLAFSPSFATLGSATYSQQAGIADRTANVGFSFGTISGTGTADTSTAIPVNGYKVVQFKVVKTGYRGTFKIQGSWDNSTFEDLNVTSLDGSAVTETYYWQTNAGYPYLRVTGDPNGSNGGTVAVSGRLVTFDDRSTPSFTGYYGKHLAAQVLLSSAARTADTATYCYVEGKGIEVSLNSTAASSGSVTLMVYGVDPEGNATLKQTATVVTAADSRTIIIAPDVTPVSTPSATTAAFVQAGTGRRWLIVTDEAASNSLTFSLAVKPVPYNYNPEFSTSSSSN